MSSTGRTPRDVLIYPVAALIGAGWLASLVDALLFQRTLALELSTPALMLLAGYVFGVQVVRSAKGNGNGNDRS